MFDFVSLDSDNPFAAEKLEAVNFFQVDTFVQKESLDFFTAICKMLGRFYFSSVSALVWYKYTF